MPRLLKYFMFFTASMTISGAASSFTVEITGEGATAGGSARSRDCKSNGEGAFTVGGINTEYTNEESYSGSMALKLTVNEGGKGGGLGGIVAFENCVDGDGGRLHKGDELWIRTRLFFPEGFEFNQNGLNKFFRVRVFNDQNGQAVSEGYNDLYIDGHPDNNNYQPFNFIFEGDQNWHPIGEPDDFFTFGQWTTVEYYLKFDDKTASEGGDSTVRVWIDGKLIGETKERRTLMTRNSYASSFNFFTYWDNEGAHLSQHLYADDILITSDRPSDQDSRGNRFIGMDSAPTRNSPPMPPRPLR